VGEERCGLPRFVDVEDGARALAASGKTAHDLLDCRQQPGDVDWLGDDGDAKLGDQLGKAQ
jgi:hypothetical protein